MTRESQLRTEALALAAEHVAKCCIAGMSAAFFMIAEQDSGCGPFPYTYAETRYHFTPRCCSCYPLEENTVACLNDETDEVTYHKAGECPYGRRQ